MTPIYKSAPLHLSQAGYNKLYNTSSKTIINRNPAANPIGPIFECGPCAAAGINSSTTT